MSDNLMFNIFISWSGQRAGQIAEALKSWLSVACPFIKPFVSKDIGAGKRWNRDLSEALDRSNFGILVLTAENRNSDWILFEAGALAKHIGEARVVPLLVDIEPQHLSGPLADFMAVRLTDQMLKLLEAINEAQPDPLDRKDLHERFEYTYERFAKGIQSILRDSPGTSEPSRSTQDMLEELLRVVKSLPANEREPLPPQPSNEQFYPVGDRILLYKFLKNHVHLLSYRNASMPALFEAAAKFIHQTNTSLTEAEAITEVAKYLISERPLKDLLDGLQGYVNEEHDTAKDLE